MLGQVQFAPILRIQKGIEAVADFQEAIRGEFPKFAIEQQVQVTVSGPPTADPNISRSQAYRFTNDPESWSVVLTASALTIEAVAGGRYSSYEEFSRLFALVWGAAIQTFGPGRIGRQGLRYVDHLEGTRSAAEWANWINPELLGSVAGDILGPELSQFIAELTYAQADGHILFRHGIAPAGPNSANGYLLDFDSVHTSAADQGDVAGLIGRFDESHDALYRLFRWSLTDRALQDFRDAAA